MSDTGRRNHWDAVFTSMDTAGVSWYRPHLEVSLEHLARVAPGRDAAIIDVGCGDSTFVDDLLALGYVDLSILDVSAEALARVRRRLARRGGAASATPSSAPGDAAGALAAGGGGAPFAVELICADVTRAEFPANRFDVWHDRAVFHFLTEREERARYGAALSHSLRPGGHAVLATFGPDGPTRCSGLDVERYDASRLGAELGPAFVLLDSVIVDHLTPSGNRQQFLHALFRREKEDL